MHALIRVAPSRGRGLKHHRHYTEEQFTESPPHGGVD